VRDIGVVGEREVGHDLKIADVPKAQQDEIDQRPGKNATKNAGMPVDTI
jgi:hypothetical protein